MPLMFFKLLSPELQYCQKLKTAHSLENLSMAAPFSTVTKQNRNLQCYILLAMKKS